MALDERSRRLLAVNEASTLGYGGISKVQRACGLSRKAIAKGIREISGGTSISGRIRRLGAGRKKLTHHDPGILEMLDRMIEPQTRDDPESPLRWICKSTRALAAHLTSKWNKVEHRLFSFILSNWRGEPLMDYETVVNLIARTTTVKGLHVTCRLDRKKYPLMHFIPFVLSSCPS